MSRIFRSARAEAGGTERSCLSCLYECGGLGSDIFVTLRWSKYQVSSGTEKYSTEIKVRHLACIDEIAHTRSLEC